MQDVGTYVKLLNKYLRAMERFLMTGKVWAERCYIVLDLWHDCAAAILTIHKSCLHAIQCMPRVKVLWKPWTEQDSQKALDHQQHINSHPDFCNKTCFAGSCITHGQKWHHFQIKIQCCLPVIIILHCCHPSILLWTPPWALLIFPWLFSMSSQWIQSYYLSNSKPACFTFIL